jgi:hypothetical protein
LKRRSTRGKETCDDDDDGGGSGDGDGDNRKEFNRFSTQPVKMMMMMKVR